MHFWYILNCTEMRDGMVYLSKSGKELERTVLIPTKLVALRKSSNF